MINIDVSLADTDVRAVIVKIDYSIQATWMKNKLIVVVIAGGISNSNGLGKIPKRAQDILDRNTLIFLRCRPQ